MNKDDYFLIGMTVFAIIFIIAVLIDYTYIVEPKKVSEYQQLKTKSCSELKSILLNETLYPDLDRNKITQIVVGKCI